MPKKDEIYYVSDKDLKINRRSKGFGHRVIITRVNKRTKKVTVKTITSLERYNSNSNSYELDNSKLDDLKNGNLVPIPKHMINSSHYSGINHREIEISFESLKEQKFKPFMIYPKRYKHLINKK